MPSMAHKPDPRESWGILPTVLGAGALAFIFTIVLGQAVVRGNPELMPVAMFLTCLPGTLWLIFSSIAFLSWKRARGR